MGPEYQVLSIYDVPSRGETDFEAGPPMRVFDAEAGSWSPEWGCGEAAYA